MNAIETDPAVIQAARKGFRIRPYFGPLHDGGAEVISYSVVFPNEPDEGEGDEAYLTAAEAWQAAARMAAVYDLEPLSAEQEAIIAEAQTRDVFDRPKGWDGSNPLG